MKIIRDLEQGFQANDENLICIQLINEKLQQLQNACNEFCDLPLNAISKIQYPDNTSSSTFFDVPHFTQNIQDTFIHHQKGVSTLLTLAPHIFASGGYDHKILVFDLLQNHEPIRTIKEAHSDVISCMIQIDQKIIVSGSWDTLIKVWNWEKGICIGQLLGHQKSVKCLLKLGEEKIASGSEDKSIRIWNWRDYTVQKIIENAHAGHVYQLINLDQNFIVSCSSEQKMKIWDSQLFSSQLDVNTPSSFVCLLKVADNIVAAGDNKGQIRIYLTKKWKEEKKIDAHKKWVSQMNYLNESVLASASWDNSILFINWVEGIKILSLDGHNQSIFCMTVLNENNFLSGSGDKKIILWK